MRTSSRFRLGKLGDVAVVFCVQTGAEDAQLNLVPIRSLLASGLEQFLFASSDRPILQLFFDDLQAFC